MGDRRRRGEATTRTDVEKGGPEQNETNRREEREKKETDKKEDLKRKKEGEIW